MKQHDHHQHDHHAHGGHASHAGKAAPGDAHAGHDKHAGHSVAMFRDKFWLTMVLAIPTSDALFTITRRLLRGKSPFWGDRGHLHHKLIDVFHWGKRRIAVFYWLTSFILGFLSLYLNTVQKLITITLVLLSVAWLLVWAKIKTLQQQHETN